MGLYVLEGPCYNRGFIGRGAQRREAPTQLEECREPCARGIVMRQYFPLGVPRGPLQPIAMDEFSNYVSNFHHCYIAAWLDTKHKQQ